MIIWNAIKGFIGRIASYIAVFGAGWVYGVSKEKSKQTEKQLEAANDRAKIEDNVSKLGPLARRRLLGKWSMPDVQTDKTNDN